MMERSSMYRGLCQEIKTLHFSVNILYIAMFINMLLQHITVELNLNFFILSLNTAAALSNLNCFAKNCCL